MTRSSFYTPYHDAGIDLEYNRLFCDDIKLFRLSAGQFSSTEWSIMLAARRRLEKVREISRNNDLPAQLRTLAFNYLVSKNQAPLQKELLACIVEVGEADGLEVLAAYTDYHLVYINSAGHKKEWDRLKPAARENMVRLFGSSVNLAAHLQPTDQPRFVPPIPGMVRITLLLSDGRYFGQGPVNHLTKDELGGALIRQSKRLLAELLAQEETL
jgi:hypothetical protein